MTTTIDTVVRIMESLPEPIQDRVLDHLREYIADIEDDQRWEASFERTEAKLVSAARKARKEIRRGLATPLDHERL